MLKMECLFLESFFFCISLRRKKNKKKIKKKNSCVSANMLRKYLVSRQVGRRFYFVSRKEQGRACNFMKIQVFC